MPAIAIVSDSDASLPPDLVSRFGIHVVPIVVQFGSETFESGVNIDDARLFERIDREGRLPTTAAPAPGRFAAVFEQALEGGAEAVVCFCVSSLVSATYAAAETAAGSFPGRDITVIDTRSLSLAQGFMVLAAAEAAQASASRQQVVARAMGVGARTHLFAALSTLKYLAMSGRVGYLAAGMAGLLDVRPVLTIQEGKLDMLERVRTGKKAWGRVLELAAGAAGGQPVERVGVVHVNARAQAERFADLLRERLPGSQEILFAELSPGLSVHSGAGMVGVALVSAG